MPVAARRPVSSTSGAHSEERKRAVGVPIFRTFRRADVLCAITPRESVDSFYFDRTRDELLALDSTSARSSDSLRFPRRCRPALYHGLCAPGAVNLFCIALFPRASLLGLLLSRAVRRRCCCFFFFFFFFYCARLFLLVVTLPLRPTLFSSTALSLRPAASSLIPPPAPALLLRHLHFLLSTASDHLATPRCVATWSLGYLVTRLPAVTRCAERKREIGKKESLQSALRELLGCLRALHPEETLKIGA